MRSEWRIVRTGAMTSLSLQIFLTLSGLLASMVLTRLLSRSALGTYFLLMSAGQMLSVLALAGVDTALLRYVGTFFASDDWAGIHAVIKRALAIFATALTITSAGALLVWPGLCQLIRAPALAPFGVAALALAGLIAVERLGSAYLRALRRTTSGIALLPFARQAFFLAALASLWLGANPPDLPRIVAWRLLAFALSAALAIAVTTADLRGRPDTGSGDAPDSRGLARVCLPMGGHVLASWALTSMDLWFVGVFCSTADAGVYGAMARAAVILAGLLVAVNTILPPILASMHSEDRLVEMEALMRRAATITGWIAVLAFAALAAAGPALVRVGFGAGYVAGVPVLLLLAAGQVASVCAGSPGWLLQMTGHQGLLFRITLAAVALDAVMNAVGAYVWGMIGVALATSIAMAARNLLMVLAARRLVGVRTYARLSPWHALRAARQAAP